MVKEFPYFMEPRSSSPCSQRYVIRSAPELDESNSQTWVSKVVTKDFLKNLIYINLIIRMIRFATWLLNQIYIGA